MRPLLGAVAFMAGAFAMMLSSSRAYALNSLDILDWACDGGGVTAQAVEDSIVAACGGAKQPATPKAACAVVSDTPFACYTPTAAAPADTVCSSNDVMIQVAANSGGYLGWQVSGTLTVVGKIGYSMVASRCNVAVIQPTPTGTGGTYVASAGTAKLDATFSAQGTGSITFLGLKVFGMSHTAQCTKSAQVGVFDTDSTQGCEAADVGTEDEVPVGPSAVYRDHVAR